MTLQERLLQRLDIVEGDLVLTQKVKDSAMDELAEARDRIDALERELRQQKAAAPLCEKHAPTGGTRSMCLVCVCEQYSSALSRISYACQPPNEYECSDYDVHCSETAVVHQVRDKIDALERENAALRKDAERMHGMQREYWESAVFTLIGHAEVLAGEGKQDMPGWFYRLAEAIARAHVDEATAQRVQELNDAAIDAAMAQR